MRPGRGRTPLPGRDTERVKRLGRWYFKVFIMKATVSLTYMFLLQKSFCIFVLYFKELCFYIVFVFAFVFLFLNFSSCFSFLNSEIQATISEPKINANYQPGLKCELYYNLEYEDLYIARHRDNRV